MCVLCLVSPSLTPRHIIPSVTGWLNVLTGRSRQCFTREFPSLEPNGINTFQEFCGQHASWLHRREALVSALWMGLQVSPGGCSTASRTCTTCHGWGLLWRAYSHLVYSDAVCPGKHQPCTDQVQDPLRSQGSTREVSCRRLGATPLPKRGEWEATVVVKALARSLPDYLSQWHQHHCREGVLPSG